MADLAREFSKFSLQYGEFLDYHPSQNAAAALLLAINICQSKDCGTLVSNRVTHQEVQALIYRTFESHEKILSGVGADKTSPLQYWLAPIEKLTQLGKEKEVKPAYKTLIRAVNESCFDGELSRDKSLFL